MNHSNFILNLVKTLKGYTTDHIINLKFSTIVLSDTDKSVFWNWALLTKNINVKQFLQINKIIKQKNRPLAFYFEDNLKLQNLKNFLINQNLKQHAQDSYMFYSKKKIETLDFSCIKKVDTENDLKTFLKTANDCYFKNDPQGPYGELGDFLKTAERAWNNLNKKGKIELYLAYKNNLPVAVSILSTGNKIGYISLVGSIKAVRGQGFGKLITLFCVNRSMVLGNQYHCLATEEGNYPNKFYQKIGFKTKFKMNIYAK